MTTTNILMAPAPAQRIHPCYLRVSAQPGAMPKSWDEGELRRCGAIGTPASTTNLRPLTLRGKVHPVFANWIKAADADLHRELQQPLLLATRILEAAGLPWLSDFVIEDIFAPTYPGRRAPSCSNSSGSDDDGLPHAQAETRKKKKKKEWLDLTARELRDGALPGRLTWQLDADMFRRKGWVGYTCRHPAIMMTKTTEMAMRLDELDRPEVIAEADRRCAAQAQAQAGGVPCRELTVLVMVEYPARMAALRRSGRTGGEEYLFTAFMAAVTILHELGHVMYWKDRRSYDPRDTCEPFYGADLEMELGDSFVASVFGGWVPVPIGDFVRLRAEEEFSLRDGLAWRQALSWDHHRLRPKHRAHYSISVDYIARLFDETNWSTPPVVSHPRHILDLIRPTVLARENSPALKTVGLYATGVHATAALPDFHQTGEGWRWNRRVGATFRIPQYDGCMCPEMDLPTATDDVIREARPRDPGSVALIKLADPETPTRSPQNPRQFRLGGSSSKVMSTPPPSRSGVSIGGSRRMSDAGSRASGKAEIEGEVVVIESAVVDLPPEEEMPKVRLSRTSGMLSPDRSEISVDELKKRLSNLIGVSLTELEKLFEGPQCG
ncbi:hypothetical protein F4778DRAFT_777045 [Xylariomycetidae sp. FL2044]|nr:hypothetical protein F4778DRAFT_777045 [Xylariomycetidae sp. FL2044]